MSHPSTGRCWGGSGYITSQLSTHSVGQLFFKGVESLFTSCVSTSSGPQLTIIVGLMTERVENVVEKLGLC